MKSIARPRLNARRIMRRRTLRLMQAASLPTPPLAGDPRDPVEFALLRNAGPAVLFENGLGATMIQAWDKVFMEIGATHTAFAYNRPGYGLSQPAATPRDGAHIVEELRALLRSQGVAPPYVLVGHSMGGLYMQLFARCHPEEVTGLVLVDPTHPRQFEGLGAVERRPLWFRLLFGAFLRMSAARAEFAAAIETGRQVLTAPAFPGKPVAVLASAPQTDAGTDAELLRFDLAKKLDFKNLHPGCRFRWIRSGHNIQSEQPEEVIRAIRAVIAAATKA